MNEPASTSASDLRDPGQRYIEEYLSPLLRDRLADRSEPLVCIVIAPDDARYDFRGKAEALRRAGHECETLVLPSMARDTHLHGGPRSAPIQLPLGSQRYDLIDLGEAGRIALGPIQRSGLVRELARICKPEGALMLPIGNRRCPVNLSGGRLTLHGPNEPTLLSLGEVEELFVGDGRFASVDRLNVAGHFGWSRIPGPAKIVGWLLDRFWRWVATPRRRWLYASPINPVAVLWIEK